MTPDFYRFGDFLLDVRALELSQDGDPLAMSPAAVRLLLFLVERRGRLVERKSIYDHLWPAGGVDRERLVNTYVRQIRRALGERSGDDRFIRTYPRRGYRFLPEVVPSGTAAVGVYPSGEAPLSWPRLRSSVGIVAAVLVVGGAALLRSGPESSTDGLSTEVRVAYLTGEELLDRPIPAERAQAVEVFLDVVASAPDFAPAHSGLAHSRLWAGDLEGAGRSARLALGLDRSNARAWMVSGLVRWMADWDWEGAETELLHAVAGDPEDAEIRIAMADLLISAGRFEEARAHLDAGRASEPTSPVVTGDLGILYNWIGDHRSALELCERTVRIEPSARWGRNCALSAAQALGVESNLPSEPPGHGESGPQTDSPWRAAVRFAAAGQSDEALDALERSAEERDPEFVRLIAQPQLRSLHGYGRFTVLRERLMGPTQGRGP